MASSCESIRKRTSFALASMSETDDQALTDSSQGDGDCVMTNKRQKTSFVWNDNPFLSPGDSYSNEKMREAIATAIMVHEYPFSIVEDEAWMWAFQYANSDFQKVDRKMIRNDCLALYEAEKKNLKAILENVSKISLTTDMWKSSHHIAEYMVITGHFIDAAWKLQKRVLSFVKVPAPRCGSDVAAAIFKCLKTWGIENKVFSISVDDASYNDSYLRNLKDDLSLGSRLVLGGALFHVRCCADTLNLLVQEGLDKIKDAIYNIREGLKYINYNDSRLRSFCDAVEQKNLEERKLVIDCPTWWNSTYQMLSCALKFKVVFSAYKEREPHYAYAPSVDEWQKVEKVCKLLQVFDQTTHLLSGSEFPTANLYLAEVWYVKRVIDNAVEDQDFFIREMAAPMKVMLDKHLGECNMLMMAIAGVLDPRWKFHIIDVCFPVIYQPKEVAKEKYKVLSKMAASILAIPIFTTAYESIFSVRRRVIGGYFSGLNEESIEALICGGNWLRHKYGLSKKQKDYELEEITLNI